MEILSRLFNFFLDSRKILPQNQVFFPCMLRVMFFLNFLFIFLKIFLKFK